MNVKSVLLMALMASMVAGCAGRGDMLRAKNARILFEGKYYPASIEKNKDDRRAFNIQVRDAALGIDGAREAGRYQATKYCIAQYGNSYVDWTVGPDTPADQLTTKDGSLFFAGSCRG